jgi:hypothetical protein
LYNSVGETCSTDGKEENRMFFPENVSEGDQTEHRGIEWTITIKQRVGKDAIILLRAGTGGGLL